MKKPRVSLDLSAAAVDKADALAALTGQSRTKAITTALEAMEPRQTARLYFDRQLSGGIDLQVLRGELA